MRDGEAIYVNRIRQQQVVHVAAVARDVDDFVTFRRLLESLDVAEFNAVVKPVPQARQRAFHESDERMRVVRRDFFGVALGAQNGLVPGELLLAHFLRNDGADRAGFQDARDNRAAVGKIRPDAGGAVLRVQGAQCAGDTPPADRDTDLLAKEAAQ